MLLTFQVLQYKVASNLSLTLCDLLINGIVVYYVSQAIINSPVECRSSLNMYLL